MRETESVIYSEKYDLTGRVVRYGMSDVLCFEYEGKKVAMAVFRNFLRDNALATMEAYVELFAPDAVRGRKLQLHNWYLKRNEQSGGLYAHGNISGSLEKEDTARVDTDDIEQMEIVEEYGEAVLHTRNYIYHCPLAHCRFRRQDKDPELIPGYEQIREKYGNIDRSVLIKPGNVLLVLSNYDEYYFSGLVYAPADGDKQMNWSAGPHVGLIQDSFLIMSDYGELDLRYFTHYRSVAFYSTETNGYPLYLSNEGDVVLYVEIASMQFKLLPGEIKEVRQENALKTKIWLPDGDLYSA